MGIVVVEVGHRRHEPTFKSFVQVYLRGVWVADRCQLVTRLLVFLVGCRFSVCIGKPFWIVEPVLRRHISHPRMLKAAVVENHIHHHLQTMLMGFVRQSAIVLIGAETRVNTVIVCGCIAMIGAGAVTVG